MLMPPTIWPFRPPPTVICKLVLHNSKGKGSGRGRGGGGSLFACKYGTMRLHSAQILFLAFTHVCMHVWQILGKMGIWPFFSIFLWFSEFVKDFPVTRYVSCAKVESAVVKDALCNDWSSSTYNLSFWWIYLKLLCLKCIANCPHHTWRWAKTTQNFEDALRHWQIKWINWMEGVETAILLITFYFCLQPKDSDFLVWNLKE